jgi:hypothetical protein
VRLVPRQPALDALANIKGLLRDKVDIDVSGGVADEMAQLRARRHRQRSSARDQQMTWLQDTATIIGLIVLGGIFIA